MGAVTISRQWYFPTDSRLLFGEHRYTDALSFSVQNALGAVFLVAGGLQAIDIAVYFTTGRRFALYYNAESAVASGVLSAVVMRISGVDASDALAVLVCAHAPLAAAAWAPAAAPVVAVAFVFATTRAELCRQPAGLVASGAAVAVLVSAGRGVILPIRSPDKEPWRVCLAAVVGVSTKAAVYGLLAAHYEFLFLDTIPAAATSAKTTPSVGFVQLGVSPYSAVHSVPVLRNGTPAVMHIDLLQTPDAASVIGFLSTNASTLALTTAAAPVLDVSLGCGYGLQLASDRILWIGGRNLWEASSHQVTLVDPTAGTFVPAVHMPAQRYYASAVMLADGASFLVMGDSTDVDIYSLSGASVSLNSSYPLPPALLATTPPEIGYLYYPALYTLPPGDLLVFSCRQGFVMRPGDGAVLASAPSLDGSPFGEQFCTQICGTPVLLPLDGGAPQGATLVYFGGCQEEAAKGNPGLGASPWALRIDVFWGSAGYSFGPWEFEPMPSPRTLASAVLLPNGNVVVVNGAESGASGWHNTASPVIEAWLYKPSAPNGTRFSIIASSTIARLYHSSAVFAPHLGGVLVAGCGSCTQADVAGPNSYRISASPTMREYRVELLVLGNMQMDCDVTVVTPGRLAYNKTFSVKTTCSAPARAVIHALGSDSHAINLGQRVVSLRTASACSAGACAFFSPSSRAILTDGSHWLFLVFESGLFSRGALVLVGEVLS